MPTRRHFLKTAAAATAALALPPPPPPPPPPGPPPRAPPPPPPPPKTCGSAPLFAHVCWANTRADTRANTQVRPYRFA
jgi:hypothetical protein